ncbi:hypothetical protein [Streptomyces phaeoluteigriseus]|uniref:hypothetical protein n=1 Tax=Streptomyces phaeoluteigriseus TaxID=114686 RepID=UPI00117BFD8F|nr:hypothetical protein [Streptomyces phaeoluteigriseus]
MTSGGRQRRDGSAKRVQMTSGDHGRPKDKKKTRRKTTSPSGTAARAAVLREVDRFRRAIQEAEQRRAARQASRVQDHPAPPGTEPGPQRRAAPPPREGT